MRMHLVQHHILMPIRQIRLCNSWGKLMVHIQEVQSKFIYRLLEVDGDQQLKLEHGILIKQMVAHLQEKQL